MSKSESDLVDVEVDGPVDVGHRDEDELDLALHTDRLRSVQQDLMPRNVEIRNVEIRNVEIRNVEIIVTDSSDRQGSVTRHLS